MKIAIASGKGGTGKTTLSVNLASLLSETQQVVLTDLDVEEPNSGIFLKGKLIHTEEKHKKVPLWDAEKCTHCGKCSKLCHFNAIASLPESILVFNELCHSCYACSDLCPEHALPMADFRIGQLNHYQIHPSLSFIEGVMDIGQESAVPLISAIKAYSDLQFNKETIQLFDAPPGTSCPMIEAVSNCDYIILVTEPTPFGLHDLKLAISTIQLMNIPFGVVINRYDQAKQLVNQYCRQQDIPIIGKIPDKKEIAEKYAKGELLYSFFPEIKEELNQLFFNIQQTLHKS